MRTDGDALRLGNGEGGGHDVRIAGMHAAGDIGRTDDRQHRLVVAHAIGAEAFAHVGIEVDAE